MEPEDAVLAAAVAHRVREEVLHGAGELERVSNDEDVGRDVARDLDGRVARKPGVGHGVLNGLAQVDELLLLMAVTRVGEELVDDVLHLLKVAHHGGAGVLGQVGKLDLEAQARDRRAKVVAHAREKQLAVGLHAAQVLHHAVEAHVYGLDLGRARILRERIGDLALTELRGHLRELGKRIDHVPGEERGAEEAGKTGSERPPEPGGAERRIEDAAVGLHPVGVAVDVDRDPEARDAVDARGEDRVLAELVLDELLDEAVEAVAREDDDLVGRIARREKKAFAGGKKLQQVDAKERVGRHERVLRQVCGRDDVLRDALRVGKFGEHAEALQPADDAEEDEAAQQNEGAPEEARAMVAA